MDDYHINCAIFGSALCALLGLFVGSVMTFFGLSSALMPKLCVLFTWWPTDVMYSCALFGGVSGAAIVVFSVITDIWRDTDLDILASNK